MALGQRRAALEGPVEETGDREQDEHFGVWVQGYSMQICKKLQFILLHTEKGFCLYLSITSYGGENSGR